MSAWSLTQCFLIGFVPKDAGKLMPDATEFDVRLPGLIETAFDIEINRRRISVPRDADIDIWLSVLYQSYIYYRHQFGPRPIQVYRYIVEWFAKDLRIVHNNTRGPGHIAHFRILPTRITLEIVQTISLNAWHALEAIEQQIAVQANILRRTIAVRRISDIFRNWKARKDAAIILQAAFRGLIGRRIAARLRLREEDAAIILQAAIRGWKVRLELRRLHNNMTLVAAQNRTAAYLRDAVKVDRFYGESHEELATFLTHINDLTFMSGWIQNIAAVNPANAAGWLQQYRREVLAITLNFRGQAAIWWRIARGSQAGPPAYFTPYTWRDDTYTHPDNNAAGNIQYSGLRSIMMGHFIDAALRPQPNYKGIDWSAVKFSGRSKEIHSLIQTVRAIATQNNLPWDPPQQLPAQHGPAIIAGIASRFSDAATDWWLQLAAKPIQIETAAGVANLGLLNLIREKFRSTSYEVDQLRRLQYMKWDENSPLVEFNVDFDQTLRDAQQQDADVNILIDYYCKTLPSDLGMTVRTALDQATVFNLALKTLENAMKMAIQANSTLAETKTSKFSTITDEKICSKCGKKGHIARFCNSFSILEAAVKSSK